MEYKKTYVPQKGYTCLSKIGESSLQLIEFGIVELWEGDWLPDKGATLKVSLIFTNWNTEGDVEGSLGIFEIDEIEISFYYLKNLL